MTSSIKGVSWALVIAGPLLVMAVKGYDYWEGRGKAAEAERNKAAAAAKVAAAAEYPTCGDAQDYHLSFLQPQIRVPLRLDCWSGWVKLPGQTNFRARNQGRLWLLPWDGSPALEFGADTTQWLGAVKFTNFRLRGDGDAAEVSIDKK
ncbi:hypothetical protein HYV91_02575 [Candidatus Wolfebacteria bacterium]|nr:hypothetical protein [Candidatus Wolfebacteria bacterium]